MDLSGLSSLWFVFLWKQFLLKGSISQSPYLQSRQHLCLRFHWKYRSTDLIHPVLFLKDFLFCFRELLLGCSPPLHHGPLLLNLLCWSPLFFLTFIRLTFPKATSSGHAPLLPHFLPGDPVKSYDFKDYLYLDPQIQYLYWFFGCFSALSPTKYWP